MSKAQLPADDEREIRTVDELFSVLRENPARRCVADRLSDGEGLRFPAVYETPEGEGGEHIIAFVSVDSPAGTLLKDAARFTAAGDFRFVEPFYWAFSEYFDREAAEPQLTDEEMAELAAELAEECAAMPEFPLTSDFGDEDPFAPIKPDFTAISKPPKGAKLH